MPVVIKDWCLEEPRFEAMTVQIQLKEWLSVKKEQTVLFMDKHNMRE